MCFASGGTECPTSFPLLNQRPPSFSSPSSRWPRRPSSSVFPSPRFTCLAPLHNSSTNHPTNEKTAALELIVSVLQTYGGVRFRSLPAAIVLVRGELCAALLHHCTSGVTGVVSLSLRVFVALVKGFKVRQACAAGTLSCMKKLISGKRESES